MKVKIKRLKPDLIIPEYAHPGDAGLDLYSLEDKTLNPNERYLFKLGFALELPPGYVALIWDKSGLAANSGITNLGGVVDGTFRGEVGVSLLNDSDIDFSIEKGDKIAQLLIQKVETAEIEEVDGLEDSPRGGGAWGSTGR